MYIKKIFSVSFFSACWFYKGHVMKSRKGFWVTADGGNHEQLPAGNVPLRPPEKKRKMGGASSVGAEP